MIDPYSKITTVDFWTDEYISRQMLKYHLDGNNDAASRKLKTIIKTVNFISEIIDNKKKIICDYGCGPGLYTNLLNRKGFKVLGVDISENSLEYARNNNKDVKYVKMNYVSETISHKVDFAMMIYCDFGALDPLSQNKVLKNIYDRLEDNGLFFFDVMSYKHYDDILESYDEKIEYDGFFMPGKCKVITQVIKYPSYKLILSNHKVEGYKKINIFNWDKCYDEVEMKVLLEDNGFSIEEMYSDTIGNKDFDSSSTLAFLCRKK